jgi:hypothetical protein
VAVGIRGGLHGTVGETRISIRYTLCLMLDFRLSKKVNEIRAVIGVGGNHTKIPCHVHQAMVTSSQTP